MKEINKLASALKITKVGDVIDYAGIKIRPTQSTNACDNCIFDTEEKADACKFKGACMAHLRKDRESVVFANTDIK